MDHETADVATTQQAYDYNPQSSYEQSYDPTRYSPTPMDTRPDTHYVSRSRSRSPDRPYHSAPRSASIADNYAPQEYYPSNDSLPQRQALASQDGNTRTALSASQSTLYVRNIALSATEEQLSELFQQHGTVESCTFLLNHQTGRPRGVAFVRMGSADEAGLVLEKLQDYAIDSRPISIERAKLDNPREKTPGLYKGRYPTRHGNSDRMRGGDSYRARPDDYDRESPRDSFRSSGRRPEGYSSYGPPGRQPSRFEDWDRPSSYVPRGGRSPPRSRGGRYGDSGNGGRDQRSYDRPPPDRSENRFERPMDRPGDRPSYYDRPPPRGSRDGPAPRYYDSAPRSSFPPSADSRGDKPGGYSSGYGGGPSHGGDRRRG